MRRQYSHSFKTQQGEQLMLITSNLMLAETGRQLREVNERIREINDELSHVEEIVSKDVNRLINEKLAKVTNEVIRKEIKDFGKSKISYICERKRNSLETAKQELEKLSKRLSQYRAGLIPQNNTLQHA